MMCDSFSAACLVCAAFFSMSVQFCRGRVPLVCVIEVLFIALYYIVFN